ncbi:hypothetical protein B0A48_10981 [Cryoendolithus antarcticus]|uniref:BTB domain-containing protein n=1 Tax=Cryoendolithus antarcticus TaxID=1507870 RepID=A0A1V8SZ73_9PEZI|nr:hypothetical protein B0A48_10981 [Cryoendolithus antarcticus]
MPLNVVHPNVTKKHSSSSSLRHTHVEHVDDLAPLSHGSRPGSEGSITPTVEHSSFRRAEHVHFNSATEQSTDFDPTPRADSAVILIDEPESGPGWNADDAAFRQTSTTTTLLIGSSRKKYNILTQSLKAASPFFAQLLATHDKSEPVHFADIEEFTFKVWLKYLYTGELGNLSGAGAEDFHALTHYMGVYCLSKRWMMEELGNEIMDLIRGYYAQHALTAAPYRLDMRAVLAKGGDLAVDFAEALMLHASDLKLDERVGESCKWHEHFDTPACGAPPVVPESEPEPDEEIAQTDGTVDSRPVSKPTQRSPARLIPAGMDEVLPHPALRGVFHKKVSPLYDPFPIQQNAGAPRQRPRTRTLGGQQDGSHSAKSSNDGLKRKETTSAPQTRKSSQTNLKRMGSKSATPAQEQLQSQVNLTQAESSSGAPTPKPSLPDVKQMESSSAALNQKPSPTNLAPTQSPSGTPTWKLSQAQCTQTVSPSGPPSRKPSQSNLGQAESSSGIATRRPSESNLRRIESSTGAPARKPSHSEVAPIKPSGASQPNEPMPEYLRRSSTIPRTNPLPSAPTTTKINSKTPHEHPPIATPGPRRPSQTPYPSPHASDSPLVPATPVKRSHMSRNQDCVCTLLGYPPCDNHIAVTRWCDCTSASHHTPAAVEAGKTDSCKSVSDCGTERRKSSTGKEAVQWEGVDAALEETDGEECGGKSGVKGVVRKLGCGGDD